MFDVVVAGFKAGQVKLVRRLNKLEGELHLNSKPSTGDKPMPQGFPVLNAGAAAAIGSFSCTLQNR